MAAFLASCGGGGSSGGGLTGGGSTGGGGGGATPTPTADCSLAARQDWTKQQLDTYYLFPNLLASGVNPASFSTVQAYIDALVEPARNANRDRGFTYITSITEEEKAATGSTAGLGVRFSVYYDESLQFGRLYVLEAFEGAPALAAGIDRGFYISAIELADGTYASIGQLISEGGTALVSQALGPPEKGVEVNVRVSGPGVTNEWIRLTKANYKVDPVSDRYGAKILDDNGKKVGYINVRTFFNNETLEDDLRSAFSNFQKSGVNEIIVDVRYNGGGYVYTAQTLMNLMAADLVGQPQFYLNQSPNRANATQRADFEEEAGSIASTKIAYIGFSGTASASELIMSAFIPYRGDNLALIGENTLGKPAGQEAVDRTACDDRLRVLAFELTNADNNGSYYDGIAPLMPNTCRATDDISAQMGDPNEASTRAALDWLAGRGTCTPVAGAPGVQGGLARANRQELLRPAIEERSAIQHRIPGIY
ncbi:S41 family peptidase [Alteriqipengyuania flavescens]|uniref:S41 family peptidase n=1 Tax=Alteriqipengyuania flavescens TaxID=3053610 RepID=UPI0025B61BB2|nr:S41 family peptidase [Alteriqipengyuania flavescens]WJY17724.1 S41 family peptidase [Alteriqipengyuania flavescens]WJY23667.1 S41 family peptidase [Alteriqipengyuania flavescens]